jgi:NAD(P)H-flavin reductase
VGSLQETKDTRTLTLEPVDGEPLSFRAGQFTMLLALGVGEVPVSISGDPTRRGPLTHTVRDVGPVSHALVAARVGSVLGVRGPFGVGWDVADAAGGDLLVVAGGIGLAPLRPAILEACARRTHLGRLLVLYGARSHDEVLYPEDLRSWAARSGVIVEVILDRAPRDRPARVGLVTQLVEDARIDAARTHALVCGPEVMMRHVATALIDRGVPPARIQLSMERNMKCGVGLCGHCQLREFLLCVDGPVLRYDRLGPLLRHAEL